jgi:flavoprotein hydroxylase
MSAANAIDLTGAATVTDVAIVGCGPVGELLGILLGQKGHSVVIFDKWPQPYALPRAVHFDDEIARVLAFAGVGAQAAAISEPADTYEWRNAAGQTLLKFDWQGNGPSGWPTANMMSQPDLENVLRRRLDQLPNVGVRRGEEVIELSKESDGVTVVTQDTVAALRTIRARYVVGCDGANSFVRNHMKTATIDLGFFYDWLILDVIPHEPRVFNPVNLQICDPERPVTVVSGGPGRRRFEFMRLPHETVQELNSVERAWQFLARWEITPDNAVLERHAVYTFAARWADAWRDGRLLLAGDAAHLMPPFAGQGMCSGMRDAANLAWKLDFVLNGTSPDSLLDSYSPERSGHVQNAIGTSVAMGNVICVTDPEAVAQRDAVMVAGGGAPEKVLPPIPPPTLGGGIVHRLPDGTQQPGSGMLGMQANVARGERIGRFDELVGTGFVVLCTTDVRNGLSYEHAAFLDSIGAHVATIVPPGQPHVRGYGDEVADVDLAYLPVFARSGYGAAVVRPDFYLFGTAATAADLHLLIDDLRSQLTARPPLPSENAERSRLERQAPSVLA